MHLRMKLLAGLWLVLLLTASGATAGAPDLRVVDAMADRDTARVRALLDAGLDPNTARADGATALLWAAHWDDGEAVDLLLQAGADANAADDHGVTPLARACENASAAMVGQLLAAGADPSAAQTNGLTPLMTAARTGSLAVVEALLARGAEVDAATAATHETALMWAVAEGHRDIVRALIASGADVRPNPRQAFSPLIAAAGNGDIETAGLLLAAGAGVDDTGWDGSHPLPYAVIFGQGAFAHFLLEQGADPNGAVDGVTALHAAAGPVDTWLKAWNRLHGGPPRARAGSSRAPSSRLALADRLPLVDALLAAGADPDARMTASGVTEQGFVPQRGVRHLRDRHRGRGGRDAPVGGGVRHEPGPGTAAVRLADPPLDRRRPAQPARRGRQSRHHHRRRHHAADGGGRLRPECALDEHAARGAAADGGGSHRRPHRGRHERERHQRGRLHGAALRGLQRPERGGRAAPGARRQHRRARLARADRLPPGGGRQAVVPLPGVARGRGPARDARRRHQPSASRAPSTSACGGSWRPR